MSDEPCVHCWHALEASALPTFPDRVICCRCGALESARLNGMVWAFPPDHYERGHGPMKPPPIPPP